MTSGGRSNVVAIFITRLAHSAAGTRRLRFRVVIANPDRGRENTNRDTLIACRRDGDFATRACGPFRPVAALGGAIVSLRTLCLVIALRTLCLVIALRTLRPVKALGTLIAFGPVGALRAFSARFAVLTIAVAARRWALLIAILIVVCLIVGAGRLFVTIAIFFITRAALILFFEPRTPILEHAEIMIGELQIIFGLNAIPGELHVARQCLIFLEQLGGITALAIVLTIAVRTT